MKTGLKTILLCFSLILLFFISTPIKKVDKNIPGEVFYTSSYKNGNFKFTPEFAIAADSNYKKSRTIRRYVSGAGLFITIVIDNDYVVHV